jgi:hypothetical protein
MKRTHFAIAIVVGTAASMLMYIGQLAFEYVTHDTISRAWFALPLPAMEALVKITPGLVAGWLARTHNVLAGAIASLSMSLVVFYSTPWLHGPPVDEGSVPAYLSLSILVTTIVGALFGVVSAAAACWLRSNNRLQPIGRENAPSG